tara:strand:- start:1146 stop:2003 length:858 start_codon:yes stop_codon:yes gene_type:complete
MAKSTNRYLDFFLKTYKVSSVNRASLNERSIVSFKGYQFFLYSTYLILIILIISFLITAYSPVKNLLPQNIVLKRGEIIDLMLRVDSLERDLNIKSQYIVAVNKVVLGEVLDSFVTISEDSGVVFENLNLAPSKEDSLLRNFVENEDFYNIPSSYTPSSLGLEDFVFFKPVDGLITSGFDVSEKHFGVDIVGSTNASVKATLDGVVIFSDWSISSGHTILIQHPNNIVSVYMHNSSITKNNNDLVKAGEVIGIVGNSGESSSGPHLHFELWQNGNPVNPLEYIDF